MKHLKYLQMWFSQMFQGRKKKEPTQTLLWGSCDWVGKTPPARKEKREVVHAAQLHPWCRWLMAQSLLLQCRWICPRWGCVTSVRSRLHSCSRVWWAGSSSQQELPWDCSYWHSVPAAWSLSSLNLSQKALDLVELKPRETQISSAVSAELHLLLY